jgi:hypothetical protein
MAVGYMPLVQLLAQAETVVLMHVCAGYSRSSVRCTVTSRAARLAACALYEASLDPAMSPDYSVFPLAFLWRHHLELAIKDVIAIGRQLEGKKWGFPGHHRLLGLWRNEAKRYVIACIGDAPYLVNVEALVKEIETIDPSAAGFRYPVDKHQTGRSMPDAPEWVNLEVLQNAMTALSTFLTGVHEQQSLSWAAKCEMAG